MVKIQNIAKIIPGTISKIVNKKTNIPKIMFVAIAFGQSAKAFLILSLSVMVLLSDFALISKMMAIVATIPNNASRNAPICIETFVPASPHCPIVTSGTNAIIIFIGM